MGTVMGKINKDSIIKPVFGSLIFINTNNLLYKIYNDNVKCSEENNNIRLTIYNSENYKKVIFHDNKDINNHIKNDTIDDKQHM
jgi:predicted permease